MTNTSHGQHGMGLALSPWSRSDSALLAVEFQQWPEHHHLYESAGGKRIVGFASDDCVTAWPFPGQICALELMC